MRVEYIGPFLAVEVPSLGGVVERGEPVDVPDEIGAALVRQATWEQHKTPAESAAEQAEIERLAAEQEEAKQAEAERLAAEQNTPPTTGQPARQAKPAAPARQAAAREEQN